jgi:DNA-binding MarR family transcriptional regulator
VDIRTELAAELLGTVGRFRRKVRRSGGDPSIGTGLPESLAELLRLIGRRPGISVREAATELGLAPNTASTLVSKLSAEGLLLRTVESRAARRAALNTALNQLDDDRIADLTKGLEVMSELTRMLTEVPK